MRTLTLEDIYAPIESSIQKVPETILEILSTSNELSADVIRYFFSGKGKLLRPALTLLGAQMVPGTMGTGLKTKTNLSPAVPGTLDALIRLASSYEIFHAATLIHDDIIDSAYLRRNLPTVNTKWDAQTAVLVGDYLHDKAMGTIFNDGTREIFSLFLKTAGLVCDGEIHELHKKSDLGLTEEEYIEIIRKKTSVLLACCVEAGARFAGATEEEAQALNRFGVAFGNAFQIVDDCLDFTGNEHEFGKTLGADLQAGVLTLPLIQLLSTVPEAKQMVPQMVPGTMGTGLKTKTNLSPAVPGTVTNDRPALERFHDLLEMIQKSGSLDYAYDKAKTYCDQAREELTGFEDSPAKQSLNRLLDYVLERKK